MRGLRRASLQGSRGGAGRRTGGDSSLTQQEARMCYASSLLQDLCPFVAVSRRAMLCADRLSSCWVRDSWRRRLDAELAFVAFGACAILSARRGIRNDVRELAAQVAEAPLAMLFGNV